MSSPSLVNTAEEAIANLTALPDLSKTGLSFTAIVPGGRDGDEGLEIKLTAGAQQSISSIAQRTREQLQDATPIAYGPAVLIPPQHWMYVHASDAATLAMIEAVVKKQDLLPFSGTVDAASKIKMIAARFTTSDKRSVTFYRIADTLLQLKKARFLALLQEGDVFDQLNPASMLLLRTDFDVIVIDGFAFFDKKSTFERAFGFLDKLRAESLTTFNAVTAGLRIEGLDQLRAACTSQVQMMSKMSSIKRSMDSDPAYASAMTTSNLIDYIENHPHVDIDIVGSGAHRKIVFDPKPKRRFQILKLLDDDFLHSVLTKRDYEAASKQQTPVPG